MEAVVENNILQQELHEHEVILPFILSRDIRLESRANRIYKRTVDLLFGGILALAILPWLIPLLAIVIKLDSRGPVFFIQKRTGRDRKSFYCIKFRTMVVNREANRIQVRRNDRRITRVGKLLRKYYIDELPQLINVILGDMSLVGPRPHMLRHNVQYAKMIRNYHHRHRIKPGMTGLAQMRGYHGMISSRKDLYNRISSDLEYIDKWSLFSDHFIFYRTIIHIFRSL